MQTCPYLTFDGCCAEAFRFYQDALGGRNLVAFTFRGTPAEDQMPENRRDDIIHARLEVGDHVLMGSDSPPDRYQRPQGISVSLALSEVAEAERVFDALSAEGSVTMPLMQTFWAKRFGMVADRFGIPWMVNCE